eukprot:SAG31_NODE_4476_length_3202_cov_3.425717_2_plen_215_part_00
MVTIGGAIASMNVGGTTNFSTGVGVNCNNKTTPTCEEQRAGIAVAVAMARQANVVVLVMGTDRTIEREGYDRIDTALPGLQNDLAKAVLTAGVPTLLILSNGGALAVDDLISGSAAIVECFNPGFGTCVVFRALFEKPRGAFNYVWTCMRRSPSASEPAVRRRESMGPDAHNNVPTCLHITAEYVKLRHECMARCARFSLGPSFACIAFNIFCC